MRCYSPVVRVSMAVRRIPAEKRCRNAGHQTAMGLHT